MDCINLLTLVIPALFVFAFNFDLLLINQIINLQYKLFIKYTEKTFKLNSKSVLEEVLIKTSGSKT